MGFNVTKVGAILTVLIGLAVFFQAMGSTVGTTQEALEDFSVEVPCENANGVFNENTSVCQVLGNDSTALAIPADKSPPMASLFGANGVIMLAIIGVLVFIVLAATLGRRGK